MLRLWLVGSIRILNMIKQGHNVGLHNDLPLAVPHTLHGDLLVECGLISEPR